MTEYKHVHVDCPGCKDHFLAPVNVEELTANIRPKQIVKEIVKAPAFWPRYPCSDGRCEEAIHKNPNYTQRVSKKCATCSQFAPKGLRKCPWCQGNDFDELDEDELEVLGIEEPSVMGDEHQH